MSPAQQTNTTSPVRTAFIGCGAGFAGDRPEAAVALVQDLASRPGPAYLFYELLAERTLAEAQMRKLANADTGYASKLFRFLDPVVADCLRYGIPIITNGGAANPLAAARRLHAELQQRGLSARIACVLGDDLSDRLSADADWLPADCPFAEVLSCNVYIGADGIVEALNQGADIVIGGRIADPSLVVGALRHAHQWAADDWQQIALATAAGHLLECCTQVSGGYFAHPGYKTVADLAHLGCPIAEVSANGSLVITKTAGSGGCVTEQTVKEQLLYEVHNPAAYLTPDVILDISGVTLSTVGPDRVQVHGVKGHPAPATLKGNLGLRGLWFGEADISYAGPGASERGLQAIEVLQTRLAQYFPTLKPQLDLIGVASLFNDRDGQWREHCQHIGSEDVRVRLGIVDRDAQAIDEALQEVEALYLNGPAGGGGVRRHLSESLRTQSFLIDREQIKTTLVWS